MLDTLARTTRPDDVGDRKFESTFLQRGVWVRTHFSGGPVSGDKQMDRARVLEVRIHLPPAKSQLRTRRGEERLSAPAKQLSIGVTIAAAIALVGLSRYHMGRGELDLARQLDEELMGVSGRRDDVAGLILGHTSLGRNLFLSGQFASSRSHLEEALTFYDPVIHRSLGDLIGNDPKVNSLGYLGIVLFCLGFPDQALARSRAAIREARRLAHPPSLTFSLSIGTLPLSFVGDTALGEQSEQLIVMASEHGFPVFGAMGMIHRGWVMAKKGDLAEGIRILRKGISAFRATGTEMWTPHAMALLARACEVAGRVEEALSVLDHGSRIADTAGARWFAAELNRNKGNLLLRKGHAGAAEELFYEALSISAEQQAKLWELRAATSLARLWGEQGRRGEARDLLAPVYGWFTEGFDTRDLRDARTLLAASWSRRRNRRAWPFSLRRCLVSV